MYVGLEAPRGGREANHVTVVKCFARFAPRLGFGDGTAPKCVTVVKFFAEFAPRLGFGDAIFPKCVNVDEFFRECVKTYVF